VHSLMCLCLLRNVKPDASIIQSTALRRFPDALARSRDTLRVGVYACVRAHVCASGQARAFSVAPGYPGSSPGMVA